MDAGLQAARESALEFDCEWCNAPAGVPCKNELDVELRRLPAHLKRLRAAGVAAPSTVGSGGGAEKVARRQVDTSDDPWSVPSQRDDEGYGGFARDAAAGDDRDEEMS